MKAIYSFLIATLFFIFTIPSLNAQTTEGKEFWLTFGQNANLAYTQVDLQIRIASGNHPTTVTIHFTDLGTSFSQNMNANEVFTYSLNNDEKQATYNFYFDIITYKSIYITSNESIVVYAINASGNSHDVTNVLPVTTLNTEYYHISYGSPIGSAQDNYAVVATQNNTNLYHNEDWVATLDSGQVYYGLAIENDITGAHIKSDAPVAFFVVNNGTIVHGSNVSNFFQQLAPVNTWGKTFFVPVTNYSSNWVRIVVSQNHTNITQTGGVIQTGTPGGGQPTLTNLQAGDFVELEISNTGCYIEANKPIAICSFLGYYSSPSQCWIPAIEQVIPKVQMASFASYITQPYQPLHYALVCAFTDAKDNTMVSIGGGTPENLSGGIWIDNVDANMSFYSMPLTNDTMSYVFTNPADLIIYGTESNNFSRISYYYLAGSGMRNLSAAFTANGIPSTALAGHSFQECDITFVANIEGIHPSAGSLKWYIDDPGKQNPLHIDQDDWSDTFAKGTHTIIMSVLFEDEHTEDYEGILNIVGRFIKIRNVRY